MTTELSSERGGVGDDDDVIVCQFVRYQAVARTVLPAPPSKLLTHFVCDCECLVKEVKEWEGL